MATSSIFTGSSQFSDDFSQIITRAVGMASLPLSQLNNQKNALTAKSAALTAMQDKITKFGAAISSLGSSLGVNSLRTVVNDSTIVKANVTAGALQGAYTINVLNAGSKTQTLSMEGLPIVADPYSASISASAAFTLTVNGLSTAIVPASNSLAELAKAINNSGAGVSANVINIGGNAAPDYRLTLQSTKLGPAAVSLDDGASNLLDTLSTGTFASYTVNGLPAVPIESDSRTVTIGMGISVDLLRAGTAEVLVEQTSDSATTALEAFVVAFNSAVAEIDTHHGPKAGALKNDPLLSTLTQELRNMTAFSAGAGAFTGLDDIGISIDKMGTMKFDSVKFSAAAAGGIQSVLSFLGSESSGGFLKNAAAVMDRLQESSTGFLSTAADKLAKEIVRQDALIEVSQSHVDQMRDNLMAKMAASDALIASLEQQAIFYKSLFEAQSNAKN